MATTAKCTFCDGPIAPSRDYREVTGFERRRAGGGTNALALRAPGDKWACEGCIRKQTKEGVNANQGSLL